MKAKSFKPEVIDRLTKLGFTSDPSDNIERCLTQGYAFQIRNEDVNHNVIIGIDEKTGKMMMDSFGFPYYGSDTDYAAIVYSNDFVELMLSRIEKSFELFLKEPMTFFELITFSGSDKVWVRVEDMSGYIKLADWQENVNSGK